MAHDAERLAEIAARSAADLDAMAEHLRARLATEPKGPARALISAQVDALDRLVELGRWVKAD